MQVQNSEKRQETGKLRHNHCGAGDGATKGNAEFAACPFEGGSADSSVPNRSIWQFWCNSWQNLVNPCVALLESLALNKGEKAGREGDSLETASESSALIDERTEPKAVERRIWRNAFVVVVLAVVAAAVFASLKFTLGLALGCLLALLNFRWLHTSVRDILGAGTTTAPPGTTWLFLFRWIVVGAVAYVALLTGYFSGVAVLVGLFTPAAAVMIETIYMIFTSFARRGEDN